MKDASLQVATKSIKLADAARKCQASFQAVSSFAVKLKFEIRELRSEYATENSQGRVPGGGIGHTVFARDQSVSERDAAARR
jgi:hypothetical protein